MLIKIIFLCLLILCVLCILVGSIYTVHNKQVAIIERLGKFHKISQPGFHLKIPFIDVIVNRLSLQLQQLNVDVESKTQDNVFVKIPVAVQYRVLEGSERSAQYDLTDPQEQIKSFVRDSVRTKLAKMNLDQAFESKDDIAENIQVTLKNELERHGFQIANTLVTDIAPAAEVRDSMNRINAAQREREAKVTLAKADKEAAIEKAKGDAETARLHGVGISDERTEISKGLAEQVKTLREAGVEEDPAAMMLTMQYLQTIENAAAHGKSNVLLLPSNPGGFNEIREQMIQSFAASDSTRHDNVRNNAHGSTAAD